MKSEVKRKTKETDVMIYFTFPGGRDVKIDTPIGFFNHMLYLLGWHMGADLVVHGSGDIDVDYHHLVEDVGIVFGKALLEAMGGKGGLNRYGDVILPMDESLVAVAVDISGRPYLGFDVSFPVERVGDFDVELIEEFFRALVNEAKITLHVRSLCGKNGHHMAEAIFKGFGRAMREALKSDNLKGVPSTKGVIG